MSYKPVMLPENHRQDFAHPKLPLLKENVKGDVILVIDESYFSNVPRYCDYITDRHTWGYEGEGPAGLAFDTLYHFTKDFEFCSNSCREFASRFLKPLADNANHVIEMPTIEKFIEEKLLTKGGA